MDSGGQSGEAPPRFSDARRQDLLRAKLTWDQVHTIEEEALPAVKSYLQELDRTNEVKRWLQRFRHAARQPGAELDSLLRQAGRDDAPLALQGACRRLAVADYNLAREAGAPFDAGFTGDDAVERLERLRGTPEQLQRVVARALLDAPPQRRRDSGVDAVWHVHCVTAVMGINLSSSPTSLFRAIAHYCFEAVGPARFRRATYTGPEQGIKDLIRREKLEREAAP